MITRKTVRVLRITADTIEKNDAAWRLFVATFLIAMFFAAWEAAAGLSLLLALFRR